MGAKSARSSTLNNLDYYVFGLGNPGGEYAHTRHNAGFDTLDVFAQKEGARFTASVYNARCALCTPGGRTALLIKPQCFMNNSGVVVRDFVKKLGLPLSKLIVVCDDVDLPLGKIRIKARGGPGTHNGMRSIVNELSSEEFARVRVGIGKNDCDIIDYVLGTYPEGERESAFAGFCSAAGAIRLIITEGIEKAQQDYN